MELLLIGFVAGFAHVVTGPDHLAALTPFASRDGHAATWRLGLRWGLGHAAGVAIVGMLLWLLKDTAMVEGFSAWAERLVGVLLIAVGALGLHARLSGKIHTHEHAHSGVSHSHIHSHFGRTEHRHSHAALGIGLLHGTAGGTHLWVLLPALAIGHLGGVILYLGAYALATVAAMTLFTAGLGGLAKRLAKRSPQLGHWFGLACCTLTIFIGGFWLLA
tara:strand:- start:11322 stop:11975 length:654 start_codon:yes stop_codon:yes gene_type:complete